MLDTWSTNHENGQDLAIIVLDQSAAYATISHIILLEKMQVLGFKGPHRQILLQLLDIKGESTII